MSTREQPTPRLGTTKAMLFVADFQRALDFYTSKLGFVTEFAYGEPPYYGLISRDRARLCLRLVCEPVFVGNIRERLELLSAVITVDTAVEIEQLFQDYQASGVDFCQLLTTKPWGARDFIIRDPDGNLVLFAGPSR